MNNDSIMRTERHRGDHMVDVSKMKLVALLAAAATMGGCMIYPDGKITTAFDQKTMKAELEKSDRYFSN